MRDIERRERKKERKKIDDRTIFIEHLQNKSLRANVCSIFNLVDYLGGKSTQKGKTIKIYFVLIHLFVHST